MVVKSTLTSLGVVVAFILLAVPLVVQAQQPGKGPRIGYLSTALRGSPEAQEAPTDEAEEVSSEESANADSEE